MPSLDLVFILTISISYSQILSYISQSVDNKNYFKLTKNLLNIIFILILSAINIGLLRLILYRSGYKQELKFEKYIIAMSNLFKNGFIEYIKKSLNPKTTDDIYMSLEEAKERDKERDREAKERDREAKERYEAYTKYLEGIIKFVEEDSKKKSNLIGFLQEQIRNLEKSKKKNKSKKRRRSR